MKPMLAATTDGKNLVYPRLASPKLDGVRSLIINGSVISRNLKQIPNKFIQSILGHKILNGFDGELIVGHETNKDVYQRTVSGVMKHDGEPEVRLFVFDDYSHSGGFSKRLLNLHRRVEKLPKELSKFCFVVPHVDVKSEFGLLTLEKLYLKTGFEGVMLRHPDGPYKYGRSTINESYLLKLKRFHDSEAIILAVSPLLKNNNEQETNELGYSFRSSKKSGKISVNKLGSMTVRDLNSGIEFDIGSGFTDSQRIEFWSNKNKLVGLVVKYKSQLVGVKEKPRFPVFLGFRSDLDR